MTVVVNKQAQMTRSEFIKFQLITHCYINKLHLSEADYNCLTLLGALGESDLNEFCDKAANYNIFKSTQTVRNCIMKLERVNLILKVGKSKKRISLSKDVNLQSKGNVLLNYKFYHIESEKS